jgi:DAK2 domain fusion protein YloV
VAPTLDARLLEGWADAAAAALELHRAEIDRINVFPVPDRDTGTNLLLTMRAATAAVRPGTGTVKPSAAAGRAAGGPSTSSAASIAKALARGALHGARGNSGVILSQVLRGVAEAVAAADGPCAGAALTDALVRGARLATEAVAHPREGTVLTVLSAAAAAAAATGSDRLDEVAAAAADAACRALRATTGQLPELACAGVVDAGGLGIYLVLDALAALTAHRPPTAMPELPDDYSDAGTDTGTDTADTESAAAETAATAMPRAAAPAVDPGSAFEVMYLLDGTDDARVAALRTALDGLGNAVAVVGDGVPGGAGTWTVHVHCTDIGAALEVGVAAGRPHGVRVAPLVERRADGTDRFARARAVVAVVCGAQAAALAREAGAAVLERSDCPPPGAPADDVDDAALGRALAGTGARHVVLLPCDPALLAPAERAAALARSAGQEVTVVPAASVIAGLAALAVHDPARHAGDDDVAMTEAAAGTRAGALQVAEAEALTWAGRCRRGDVLGIADGEVVVIAPDLAVGALWLASRMLTAGGELVTVLLGAGVADVLGDALAAELRRTHPEVDVVVHRGARPGVPMELGVE